MNKLILFDLDGTLTESATGITACVAYAFQELGYPACSRKERQSFVGPPLHQQFKDFLGVDDAAAAKLVQTFRVRYEEKGWAENSVYAGIPEMLEKLKSAGHTLAVATSKPEFLAKKIVAHFGLAPYFDYLVGATPDDKTLVNKPDIINVILKQAERCEDRSDVFMVGDRSYDIIGAKKCGIKGIGVLYGYGSREELEAAGADALAETVGDLTRLLKE